jgi:hypothetical protein
VRTMFDPRHAGSEPIVIVVPETISMSDLSSRISAWATRTQD